METSADLLRRGEDNEERFFSILEKNKHRLPDWYLGIEKTGPSTDARGVDAICSITHRRHRRERVMIPIQIKGSRAGMNLHLKAHSSHYFYGVVFVIINSRRDDEGIFQYFLSQITRIWMREISFNDFFRELHATPLSHKGMANRRLIEEREDLRSQGSFLKSTAP